MIDVLIVGSGIAGLYTALLLNQEYKIKIICKSRWHESNSFLAQAGILHANSHDGVSKLVDKIMVAGNYKNDYECVENVVRESEANLKQLMNLGVRFKNYPMQKQGLAHCNDKTGEVVLTTLWKEIMNRENIELIEDCRLIDLIIHKDRCLGGICWKDGQSLRIKSQWTVLATGGIGGLFRSTTNNPTITGDGLVIAHKNKVKIHNIDYIQYHPTSFYGTSDNNRRELVSEALRKHGAKLLNIEGERFIDELLPRDRVVKAIVNEMNKTNSEYVYLDITMLSKEEIIQRFPKFYEGCSKRKLNPAEDLIPVVPCQHFHMGGIKVSSDSQTSINGLYAIGEVSSTGLHGNNRLVGNALLEAIVYGKRVANKLNNHSYRSENYKDAENNEQSLEEFLQYKTKVLINLFKEHSGGDNLMNYKASF